MEQVCSSLGGKSLFLSPLTMPTPQTSSSPCLPCFHNEKSIPAWLKLETLPLAFLLSVSPFPPKESPSSEVSPPQQMTTFWHPCSLPSCVQALVASHLGFCQSQAQCSLSLPLRPLLTLHCLLNHFNQTRYLLWVMRSSLSSPPPSFRLGILRVLGDPCLPAQLHWQACWVP